MLNLTEVISELCKLLSRNKSHINFPWKVKSKYQRYWNWLNTKTDNNINALAKDLGYEDSNSRSFIRLQQRFENKLAFLVFTIDVENEGRNEHGKNANNIILYYSQGKLLLQRAMRPVAMFYFNKALNIAKKSAITEYEYLVAFEFYKYYSIVDFNKKKKEEYHHLLMQKQELMNLELEFKSYESDLVGMVSKNVNKTVLIESAAKYASYCLTRRATNFSYLSYVTSFQIIVFYYNLIKNYQEIYAECERARIQFSNHGFLNIGSTYLIDKTFLNALISSNDFLAANEFISTHKTSIIPGTHNYYTRLSRQFLVLVRLKNFHEASALIEEVFDNKTLILYKRYHELWLIKKAYVHLLVELNVITNPTKEFESITKYKLNKLLNQISIYAKDKTGQNAGLKILEMCFYIVRKSEDKLIDRIESIRQYAYKYLRNDEHLRLKIFFRFIITCYDKRYNVIAIKRHTQDIHKRLLANPQELTDSVVDAEIIPFESLWDNILEYIANNYSQRV